MSARKSTKFDNYFIACGDLDADAQATFTDIRDRRSASVGTTDADAAFVLNHQYEKLMISMSNTGAALTDFQILGQFYKDGPWHVYVTGAGWASVAGVVKYFNGAPHTLASGATAAMYLDVGCLYAVKVQAKIANGVRNRGTFTAAANPTNTAASQTLVITDTTGENYANAEVVVIDGVTYTAVTALSVGPTVPFEFLIGADANASQVNLAAAINLDAGEGTIFSEGTTEHETVSAAVTTDGDDEVLTVTAKTPGSAGNSIEVTTDAGDAAWTAGTLLGGTTETFTIGSEVFTFKADGFATEYNDVEIAGSASDTLDNAIEVVNGVHTQVVASAGAGDTMVVNTINGITNAVGTLIATTEDCAQCSWSAATMADAVMTAVSVTMVAGE